MAQDVPSNSDNCLIADDEDLQIDDETREIARIRLPNQVAPLTSEENDERIAKIEFHCTACNMHELVHYYGRKPPFALGVHFREDNFVMRDPFQAPPLRWQSKPEYYVALGVKCANCAKVVCKDPSCSFYYSKTYCLPCGKSKLQSWPVEAQTRLRKQLAAKQDGNTK